MEEREKELAARLRRGEERALEAFWEAYYTAFVGFARQLVGEEETAKDVVQEAFVAYWEAREGFEDLVAVRAFFYKTIRHKCLNVLRHREVEGRFAAEQATRAEDDGFVHEKIVEQEMYQALYKEIGRLTKTEQRVLMLALEGKSNEEIAEALGVAVSTVKSHKANSYAELRRRLQHLRVLVGLMLLG